MRPGKKQHFCEQPARNFPTFCDTCRRVFDALTRKLPDFFCADISKDFYREIVYFICGKWASLGLSPQINATIVPATRPNRSLRIEISTLIYAKVRT